MAKRESLSLTADVHLARPLMVATHPLSCLSAVMAPFFKCPGIGVPSYPPQTYLHAQLFPLLLDMAATVSQQEKRVQSRCCLVTDPRPREPPSNTPETALLEAADSVIVNTRRSFLLPP